MPSRVPIPKESHNTTEISLSGNSYLFTYRFNSRTSRWKLDISLSDGTTVVNGLSLIENFSPTAHLTLDDFNKGMLFVFPSNLTDEVAGRSNIGVNKDYELVYSSFSELVS